MTPRPKPSPNRLGPPPQLTSLKVPEIKQRFEKKVQPKLQEIFSSHAKIIARWFHTKFSWKRFLMSWMILLIASKMVLLALTFQYFSLTSLLSLQIFHGVWTLAFVVLIIIESKMVLPNASCLLAGYLPATTVLHILLIPSDYPLEFIITDAISTLLAIVTMFLLLRLECTQIIADAEKNWKKSPASEAGTNSTVVSSKASTPEIERHVIRPIETVVASPQYQVNYASIDDRDRRELDNTNMGFEEGIDLEPIDFEHFIEEPELGRNHMERMFSVNCVDGPARGR